ncbi:SDR family oxidoreductase [Actinoplanes regularis]|uniref:SDR family oxidoreductase n=1 Tax=Actinoplanes regularis TaxID=52697 RepID=UPI0024A20C7E|nr:NAD(P)H-binding protein [Actinoplanes regularis]GLW28928.1 nucleotide-diphosphate-sugar epimerase [Actinoplanes regularis]
MVILVTGATGNVGRMVVDELLALGATSVRALTADPERAALPPGVEVVRGHFGRLATVSDALAGVERMYLAPHPPSAAAVSRLAADHGVRHIVDMSGPKGAHWQAVEDGVEASGVPFTHLEPGEFMANGLLWAPQIQAGDLVRDAYPEVVNAPIAQEDIAAVAARVLLSDGHVGKSYELTGPVALSRRRKVSEIGAGLGRTLRYVELTGDAARAHFTSAMGDYGAWYLEGLAALESSPQQATSMVFDLLGRPAMSYREWASRHADQFR